MTQDPQNPYGGYQGPPQQPPPGYEYPPGAYGYAGQPVYVQPTTNGLAIAGFVCSFFRNIVGLILSIVAINQINNSGGTQTGKGLAIAGMVISIVSLALALLYVLGIAAFLGSIDAAM